MARFCRRCKAAAVVQRDGVKHITRCTVCDWKSVKYMVSKGNFG